MWKLMVVLFPGIQHIHTALTFPILRSRPLHDTVNSKWPRGWLLRGLFLLAFVPSTAFPQECPANLHTIRKLMRSVPQFITLNNNSVKVLAKGGIKWLTKWTFLDNLWLYLSTVNSSHHCQGVKVRQTETSPDKILAFSQSTTKWPVLSYVAAIGIWVSAIHSFSQQLWVEHLLCARAHHIL